MHSKRIVNLAHTRTRNSGDAFADTPDVNRSHLLSLGLRVTA